MRQFFFLIHIVLDFWRAVTGRRGIFAGTDHLLFCCHTQDDPGFMEELRIFIRKEVLRIFEGRSRRSVCFLACIPVIYSHFYLFFLFLSFCRKNLELYRSSEDARGHLSIQRSRASRTSWQGRLPRPTGSAWIPGATRYGHRHCWTLNVPQGKQPPFHCSPQIADLIMWVSPCQRCHLVCVTPHRC